MDVKRRTKGLGWLLVLGLVMAVALVALPGRAQAADGTTTDASGLEALYIEGNDLRLGDTQTIAALGVQDGRTLTGATLHLSVPATGQTRDIPADNVADNGASFTFPYDDGSLAGVWKVDSVDLAWDDGTTTVYTPPADDKTSQFTFMEGDATPAADQSADSKVFVTGDGLSAIVTDDVDEAAQTPVVAAAVGAPTSGPIALDAGHGGTSSSVWDSGATGFGLTEANLTGKIRAYCQERLNQLGIPNVLVPRYYASGDPMLRQRCDWAKSQNARALVSFHINASGGTGSEVLIPNDSSYNKFAHTEGTQLAQELLPRLQSLGLANRGTVERDYGGTSASASYPDGSPSDYYGMLRYARLDGMTGLIIEHAFIDNASDAGKLANENFLKQLGYADAEAIAKVWPATASAGATAPAATPTASIMGAPQGDYDTIAAAFIKNIRNNWNSKGYATLYGNKGGIDTPEKFVRCAWDTAITEGVRPEVLLAQIGCETGWLRFGGIVNADMCNFGGLGALDHNANGNAATFNTVQEGLLAQVQHLKAYGSKEPLNRQCFDPRFNLVNRGSAPNVEDLGGRWASDKFYGYKLVNIMNRLYPFGNADYVDGNVNRLSNGNLRMFRLYNPNSGEHFYTSNALEYDQVLSHGWRGEGYTWTGAPDAAHGTPVYRAYNPVAGDHHYTISRTEIDQLVAHGWKDEGVSFYSSKTATATPVYRLYNPNAWTGAHHFTTSAAERDSLRAAGWRYEGIAWYGM